MSLYIKESFCKIPCLGARELDREIDREMNRFE